MKTLVISRKGTHRSILPALLLLALPLAVPGTVAAEIGDYHSYAEVYSDLAALAAAHPTRARLSSIGHGWEPIGEFDHRQIWALKISDNVSEEESEPEVAFTGAHHAREWISVEVPLAIAHHLLDNYATDPAIQELVDNKVIWVIPMVNPDGHQYTVTTNRCWRKNRRNNGDGSFGVDLNRNYGYQWGGAGSTSATNDDVYRGLAPFSEPETQALRDFLRLRPHLRALITFHSYTQAVLRPWSYAPGVPPPGELMLKDLSNDLRQRILAVYGEAYSDLPPYAAAGEMTDWVYHELGIPAFTIELRPKYWDDWPAPSSCYGFELPESQIEPTLDEILPAALALIRNAQEGNIMIKDHPGDTGAVPSSTLTPDGWDPVFWLSPDIWSDPLVPVRGGSATITARVHNLTGSTVNGVTVQIWYTDPRITLEFPAPGATKLGEGAVSLPPYGTADFSAHWAVPPTPNILGEYHWCIGVVIKHPDDLPVSTQALYSNNVAFHNFEPAPALAATTALQFFAENLSTLEADLDVFVTSEGLPEGGRVQLDPRRPHVLAPGESYLGFAEVILPEGRDLEPGEATVHIQGALTPRRPGGGNPVGSGIEYRVAYGAPSATADRPQLGVHLDYGFPRGSFANDYDPGPSFTLDLEIPITPRWSLLGIGGYHSFPADVATARDFSVGSLAFDLRGYVPLPAWRWFVQGGAGFYAGDPGPDELGLNLGFGLDLPLTMSLAVELGLDGHWIDPGGLDRAFLDSRLGCRLRL